MTNRADPASLVAAISLAALTACSDGTARVPLKEPRQARAGGPAFLGARPIPLPGSDAKPIALDYLACDRSSGRVWVPAGNSGSVDVIEGASGSVRRIGGFGIAEHELRGRRIVLGPSSVALGEGVAYIGNRGDSKICVVDAKELALLDCVSPGGASGDLTDSPDAIVYIAVTRELWVTSGVPVLGLAPSQLAIRVFDVSSPRLPRFKESIALPASPEGYAVDERRGIFYTNLEEKNRTVAIDVRSRRILSEWGSVCGAGDPRGLAVDSKRNLVLVACADHIVSLDATQPGRKLAWAEAGDGLDNIDYLDERGELYVAAGAAALLTVFRVGNRGELIKVASAPTAKGARVVVADRSGKAYVADSLGARILAFPREQ